MKYLFMFMSALGAFFTIMMTHLLVNVALYGSAGVREPNSTILTLELIVMPVIVVLFFIMTGYWMKELWKTKKRAGITPPDKRTHRLV